MKIVACFDAPDCQFPTRAIRGRGVETPGHLRPAGLNERVRLYEGRHRGCGGGERCGDGPGGQADQVELHGYEPIVTVEAAGGGGIHRCTGSEGFLV